MVRGHLHEKLLGRFIAENPALHWNIQMTLKYYQLAGSFLEIVAVWVEDETLRVQGCDKTGRSKALWLDHWLLVPESCTTITEIEQWLEENREPYKPKTEPAPKGESVAYKVAKAVAEVEAQGKLKPLVKKERRNDKTEIPTRIRGRGRGV